MGTKVRRATLSDAAVIAEFNLKLARETEGLGLDAHCVAAGVLALLEEPAKGIYYLAEIDRSVVGQLMITYEWSDWRNGTIWWLQSVYVKEEFRGRGVFRALFEHLVALARGQPDVCGLRLYMHADNGRARTAYEKLGMKPTRYEVLEMEINSTTPDKPR